MVSECLSDVKSHSISGGWQLQLVPWEPEAPSRVAAVKEDEMQPQECVMGTRAVLSTAFFPVVSVF